MGYAARKPSRSCARKRDLSKCRRPVCGRAIRMTSPSRRKRRTTRRSTNPRNLTSAAAAALGCWVALAGGLSRAGELQWRSAQCAATPAVHATAPAVQAVMQAAAWEDAGQATPLSRRSGDAGRSAQRDRPSRRRARCPSGRSLRSLRRRNAVDRAGRRPRRSAACLRSVRRSVDRRGGEPQVAPNSFPAPSLEEAFEEPTVEQPSVNDPPTTCCEEESTRRSSNSNKPSRRSTAR